MEVVSDAILEPVVSQGKQNERFGNCYAVVLRPGNPVRWMNYSNTGAKPRGGRY